MIFDTSDGAKRSAKVPSGPGRLGDIRYFGRSEAECEGTVYDTERRKSHGRNNERDDHRRDPEG